LWPSHQGSVQTGPREACLLPRLFRKAPAATVLRSRTASVRTSFRSSSQPAVRLARSSFLLLNRSFERASGSTLSRYDLPTRGGRAEVSWCPARKAGNSSTSENPPLTLPTNIGRAQSFGAQFKADRRMDPITIEERRTERDRPTHHDGMSWADMIQKCRSRRLNPSGTPRDSRLSRATLFCPRS